MKKIFLILLVLVVSCGVKKDLAPKHEKQNFVSTIPNNYG